MGTIFPQVARGGKWEAAFQRRREKARCNEIDDSFYPGMQICMWVMWTSDIADSDLITAEKADFLLAEAKEQLASTVEDAEALTKTGIYLLGGLLTVTSGLVGVTATLFSDKHPVSDQKWSAILPLLVTSLYLTADAAIIMWSALSTKGLDHRGNAPANLATQEIFRMELRLMKFAEAASYQARIERNHFRNESIGVRINRGIKAACLAPLVYLVAQAVAQFIFRPSFPR